MLNFAQPWMLWGLLAASLPIIIHLINRWRHKSVPWAAMAFLFRATKGLKGTKKLRHYLILAARVLAVAALAFALSRPRTSSWLGMGGNQPENILIILDRSASMEIRQEGGKYSLRELTLERLKNTMNQMRGSRFFMIESAGGNIMEISSPDILPSLSETTATDTRADFPLLIEKAAQYMEEYLTGRSEVWIASDMQNSNWVPESGRWELARGAMEAYSGRLSVRILSMRDRNSQNRTIRVTNTRIRNNELVLSLDIHQWGNSVSNTPVNVPVTISINGGRLSDSILVYGDMMHTEKAYPLPLNVDSGYGFVSLPNDSNLRDDVSYFTFVQDKEVKIITTGEISESLSILQNMAAPPSLPGRQGTRVPPDDLVKTDLSSVSLVIWAGSLPSGEVGAKIGEYVGNGGLVLFVPGQKGPDSNEFSGFKWGERQEAPQDKLFLMPSWETEMGPLRDGADGRPIAVDHVRAIIRQSIIGEGMTLAVWDDDTPALVRKVEGKGQFLFLGTEPLYEWSNLADGYMLLPFLQRLVEEASDRFAMPNSHDLGSWELPVASGQAAQRIDGYDQVSRPFNEFMAGVYLLDSEHYVLNRPSDEDIMEEISADRLKEVFGSTKFNSLESDDTDTESLVRETWKAFYIFLILMLVVESLLCLPQVLRKPEQS